MTISWKSTAPLRNTQTDTQPTLIDSVNRKKYDYTHPYTSFIYTVYIQEMNIIYRNV